jgi:hypothetical protein
MAYYSYNVTAGFTLKCISLIKSVTELLGAILNYKLEEVQDVAH